MPINVAIFLFDDVEVLDFAGPFEVFCTAARVHERELPGEPRLFEVFTVAEGADPVVARGELRVTPTYSLESHPRVDLLVVPGGVVDAELDKDHVINWVHLTAASARVTASVCTGAFLLAEAGVLKDKAATTHWEDIPALRSRHPDLEVRECVRWVDEGSVVTSAGISAGIDMSLHLVARLAGEDLATRTSRQMEFESRWYPSPD